MQLRWPTLAEAQPNVISLIEAQQAFVEYGACDPDAVSDVRGPRPGEAREPSWRPLDRAIDDFESGPEDPDNLPWPSSDEQLYWWRPTYFRRPENRHPGPAPRQPPSNVAEEMMARIIALAPETQLIDVEMRSLWEAPAPLHFCSALSPFVVEAVRRGDTELAAVIVDELNAGLLSGDDFAATCVCVGFLEPQFEWSDQDESEPTATSGFRDADLEAFVEGWPAAIKGELHRQIEHQRKRQLKVDRDWGQQHPDGSWTPQRRWKLRHPILWWKMRRGWTFAG